MKISVAKCDSHVEALDIQAALQDEGIEGTVIDDNSPIMGVGGKTGAVASVYIDEADEEAARAIINKLKAKAEESTPWCPECGCEEVDHIKVRHSHGSWALLVFAPVMIAAGLFLPLGPLFSWIVLAGGVIMLVSWFIPYTEDRYTCRKCGNRFKPQ